MCHIGIWVCPIAPIRERMTEISRGGGGGVLWSAPRRLRLDGEAGGGVEEEGGVLGGGPAVVQILHRPVVARTRSLKSKIFQNINTDCLKNRKMSAYRIVLYVQCTNNTVKRKDIFVLFVTLHSILLAAVLNVPSVIYLSCMLPRALGVPSQSVTYSWFHIKGTWSVHLFIGDYLSIPETTGSCWYLFHEIPGTWPVCCPICHIPEQHAAGPESPICHIPEMHASKGPECPICHIPEMHAAKSPDCPISRIPELHTARGPGRRGRQGGAASSHTPGTGPSGRST